jgi:DNA-directed RNA polymerase subunit RPC12/RpoP
MQGYLCTDIRPHHRRLNIVLLSFACYSGCEKSELMDKQVMAKCPKCGFWMLISARVQDATVAPTSMCTDRAGWNHCQTLKPALAKARSSVR